ncbi:SDR family oxidoreductase [uncultured Umboniibacter sp.]|uniref:SDR family oxidoreductase n=1 Tax=uncultured Umboniibacter sp. TaxID=1798917 RepID=UPI002633E58B|nr:SDR family oxidoreductase [uncultured Umboniibacter sp.]
MNTIVVSGASRRFGLMVAERYLKLGWQVIALSRQSSAELDTLVAQGVLWIACDYEDKGSVLKALGQIEQRVKSIQLLVHNASYFAVDSTDFDAWDQLERFNRVHVQAPALMNYQLQPLLTNLDQPGLIVHLSDIFADRPRAAHARYCSSKAALENLTKSLALKWAPGIRVNSIQPGPVKFLPSHSEADKARVLAETPLGYEAGFEPLLKALDYLVDNQFVTGCSLKVDGGRSIA